MANNIKEIVARVMPKPVVLSAVEALFNSLQKQLGDAVDKKFGASYWMYDFSKEMILLKKNATPTNALSPVAADVPSDQFYQVKWKFVKGEVEFDGNPVEVRRVVTYV